MTLAEVIGRADDGAPALIVPEEDRIVTAAQLSAAVSDLGRDLAALGVGRGDRVSLALPNGPEVIIALLAVMSLGAAAAPLNPAYTADEHRFYLGDLRPRLVLAPQGDLPAVRHAAGADVPVIDVTIGAPAPRLLPAGHAARAVESAQPEDIALLLHTSGTTSRPKQVPLLHRNLAFSARSIADHLALTGDDVAYCAMPLFHVHGLIGSVLSSLAAGGSVIVPRRFTPRAFWEQRARLRPTWLTAVPTIYQAILDRDPGADDGSAGLRFLRSASSPLAPSLLARIEKRFEVPMLEAYGMTEASHQIAANPLPPRRREPGSVGVAVGSEVTVLDDDGAPQPDGMQGQIAIRGPGLTPGYLENAQANAAAFVDGWFRTGDRGVVRDGYIYLQGRLKELINRGGEKISPYEIEDTLLAHPHVAEAVCFAIPDERYGEQVGAAVRASDDVRVEDLLGHCRERLAAFKVPRRIQVVDAIPRTATGKVQRSCMHDLLAGG